MQDGGWWRSAFDVKVNDIAAPWRRELLQCTHCMGNQEEEEVQQELYSKSPNYIKSPNYAFDPESTLDEVLTSVRKMIYKFSFDFTLGLSKTYPRFVSCKILQSNCPEKLLRLTRTMGSAMASSATGPVGLCLGSFFGVSSLEKCRNGLTFRMPKLRHA